MPKVGVPDIDQLPDHRHGVFAGRRRIARPVRQEHAVRLERHDVLGRGLGRHHRHLAAGAGEQAQDVALDAVVDRDHVEFRIGLAADSLRPTPTASRPRKSAAPMVTIGTRSMPTRPGHSRASFLSAARSNLPSAACAITAFGMPFSRISAVSARVSMPAQPDDAAGFQPVVEIAGGAVVRRRRDGGMQDDAAGARPRRHVDALDVVLVGADIADVRET